MKFVSKTRLALLATVATTALIQPAMALDAQKFVDRLAATYNALGYSVTPGPVTGTDDTVTMKGLTFAMPKGGVLGSEPAKIDTEVTFTGVKENADGSYLADAVTVPDIDYDFTDKVPAHVSLKNIEVNGLYVPPEGPVTFTTSLQLLQSISAGPLLVTRNGKDTLSLETVSADTTFNPAQGSPALVDVASTFDVTGLKADLSALEQDDPAAWAVVKALDLQQISGTINQSMTWTIASGDISIDNFVIDLVDKGALSMVMDMSGFTPEIMGKLAADQAANANKTPTELEQANAAMGMQVLQAVSIGGLSLRYDDAGLAPKVIDYFAAQQGTDRASFVTGLKTMAPMMLSSLGIPALDAIVTPALNSFLDDPQSLEIAVAPEAPVSLISLVGGAANPAGLITMLGLTVTANTTDEDSETEAN